jgi:malate permease and related proteins
MSHVNHVFLITLCIVVVGFFIKKYDFLTEKEGKTISKFLMHTTFPALMLVSTVRLKLEPSLYFIPFIAIAFGIVTLTLAWFFFKKEVGNMRGLLTMSSGGSNIGLFAFPIIEGIWGRDALMYAIMFDIGNTAVVFGLVYTLGNYFATKNAGIPLSIKALSTTVFRKVIKSPPLQGMVLGLFLNISGIGLPTFAIDFLDILAQSNKAIGMLLLGIYLNFSLNKKQLLGISKVLIIRYGCGLGVVALFYFGLPPSVFRSIIIVCMVLPVGLTLLPFSDELNFDFRMAGLLVNLSLVISFILLWSLVLGLKLF